MKVALFIPCYVDAFFPEQGRTAEDFPQSGRIAPRISPVGPVRPANRC